MTDIQALDSRYVAHTYARAPVTFVRGEGCRLYDEAGKAYIDMGSGIAVNALGYGVFPDREENQWLLHHSKLLLH